MRRIRAFLWRVSNLLRARRRERELADEIESHLALHTEDGIRAGLAPIEARRKAILRLGGVDSVKESYRDRRGLPLLEHALQDLRYAARFLRRNPSFTVVAVATLALGIGGSASMFQLLDAVALRSLPVNAPSELVEVRIANPEGVRGNTTVWHAGATNAIWEQIRDRQQAFSGVLAWSPTGVRLTSGAGDPRFASALLVSGDFFTVRGVSPLLGRVLTRDDDRPGCMAPAAVIGHAFWQSEFGGDTTVIGRRVTLGGHPFEIVGVTPPQFTGLDVGRRFDVAVPLCAEALPPGSRSRLDSGVEWFLIVMARLKPGWTIDQATAHLASLSPALFDASLPANYPPDNISQYRAFQLAAQPAANGISGMREQYVASLWLLQATAALVLVIGCANLANLMLARFTARARDIAVRVALGAGRKRLIQLLLAESLLLSIAAAIAGGWLAGAVSTFLVRSLDPEATSLFLETSVVPLSGATSDNDVWIESADSARHVRSYFVSTSASYFATMSVPLVAGRLFDDERDTPGAPRVAIVNEAFVQTIAGGSNPVGRLFWREARAEAPVTQYQIVGVVKNAKYRDLREEVRPVIYLPLSQEPQPATFAQLLVRTSVPAGRAIPVLKTAITHYNAAIVPTFQDLREMVGTSLLRDRLVAQLSGFFGTLAVLLATLGLYGVISFTVTRRAKEIAICIALGADAIVIARLILAEAAVLVIAGCIAGAAVALVLARSISTLVYGLAPNDPATLGAAAVLLALVALVASGAPARRAARLGPVAALRLD